MTVWIRSTALLAIGITISISIQIAAHQASPDVAVRAWSSDAGPYGTTWYLELNTDGSGTVMITAASTSSVVPEERKFYASLVSRAALVAEVERADFFTLPSTVGPDSVPLHASEHCLEITAGSRSRKVFLHEPKAASGTDVERFRRAWRAVVSVSPIRPPE